MYSFLVEFNPLKLFSVAKKKFWMFNPISFQLSLIAIDVGDFRFAIPGGYQSYMSSVCVNWFWNMQSSLH